MHRCCMFLSAGGQSKPQHGAMSRGQPRGFRGITEEPLEEPLPGAALPGLLLLCPWLSSNLFSTTISCFPMSPPGPSPAISRSPRRAALGKVGGFQLLELLRVA